MAYKVVLTEGKVLLSGITTKLYFLAKKYDGLVLPKSCTLAEKSSTMYAYEKVVLICRYVLRPDRLLFNTQYTNRSILWGVYGGEYIPGNILVDDPRDPRSASV